MDDQQTTVTCKGCGVTVVIPIKVSDGKHAFDFAEVRAHLKATGHSVDGTNRKGSRVSR